MQVMIENTIENDSFIHKYTQQNSEIHSFFDYNLSESDSQSRYNELIEKTFQRENLVHALKKYNEKYHPSPRALQQVERLRDPKSVVVVGGQQAGMLTGPLYTVNKIISILLEAKNLEEKLSAPVIPIFWIAGEDHDIDEVNHTYFFDGENSRKIRIAERNDIKSSMSDRYINVDEAKKELEEAFLFLHETSYTKKLYNELLLDLSEELTYTDWCAKILHRLFRDTDLVLMDAADPLIRKIEQPYFEQMVEKNDALREAFLEQGHLIKEQGLGEPISLEEENAHLFFHEGNQRFLLERTDVGFREKQGVREWTEAELLEQVKDGTLQLSNNVVTRPIMQDFLLPVHTFIAGPGELKYWAALKQAFHQFDRHMPVVRPRLHLTLVSRKSEKNLMKYEMNPVDVTMGGVKKVQQCLINEDKAVDEEQVLHEAEQELQKWLSKVQDNVAPLGKGVAPLNHLFQSKMKAEFHTYEKKVKQYLLVKNETHISRLNDLEMEIKPHGNWQERYLNIYPYLNLYGDDLVKRTLSSLEESSVSNIAGSHLYIYL
ncbi:bacillithiol biosynthesis cysteine-adding enzyme BshC [Salipaludibacillus daqingensis]|uniref:bacillithiol biosynthesis cysteine-adding enzyme BshC n=1 Tax=Salipaludibacillus daqingensis TaxID=3041001 RepID=UPI002476A155|nr:bacillithiol biosynthesis cysteine-adding enzyme BshC [Salipaludibacillus daqingensis]